MNKILVVDDKLYIRAIVSKELVKEGYQVNCIYCAESLWDSIHDYDPDLVLLGLWPEGHDCWGILEEAKQKLPKLPVLIYVVRCFEDISSLRQAVNEVLGNTRFAFKQQSRRQLLTSRNASYNLLSFA